MLDLCNFIDQVFQLLLSEPSIVCHVLGAVSAHVRAAPQNDYVLLPGLYDDLEVVICCVERVDDLEPVEAWLHRLFQSVGRPVVRVDEPVPAFQHVQVLHPHYVSVVRPLLEVPNFLIRSAEGLRSPDKTLCH